MAFSMEVWLELLRCPHDQAVFRWQAEASEMDGTLHCTSCATAFPVREGIVRCVKESFDDARKAEEMMARDQMAATYEHDETNREEDAIPRFLAAMRPAANDTVIDLGCGVGMITRRYAPSVRRVIGMDFSLASLRLLRSRLAPELQERVLLIQADICAPPVKRHSFDKVVSSEVFHHLPTPEMRQAVLRAISDLLAEQGTFTCSVYNWSVYKKRRARQGISDESLKEGKHDSGIYYYNFEAPEFAGLLRQAGLRVTQQRGLMVALPGAGHLGALGRLIRQAVGATPLGTKVSHLLLTHGRHA